MSNVVSIRQATRIIEKLIGKMGPDARILLQGAPGVAKSSIVRQVAARLGYTLIDLRLVLFSPEMLGGYPYIENGVMRTSLPDWFPTGEKVILFLDELGQAPIAVQNVALQLVLDRHIGQHWLPADTIVIGATNRPEDRAGAGALTTALYSRFTTAITIEPEKSEVSDHFKDIGANALATAWLERIADKALDFDPRDKGGFLCPRTLENAGNLLTAYENDADNPDLKASLHGLLGERNAVSLLAFVSTVASVPDYADIIADPMGAPMDVSMVQPIAGVIETNLKFMHVPKVMQYVGRFPQEQQAVILSRITLDHPDVQDAKAALGL